MDVPYGYCHCGCGGLAPVSPVNCKRNGWVRGEPKRYIVGHHRRKHAPQDYVVDENGCWVWQKATIKGGRYGALRADCYGVGMTGEYLAHRHYYALTHGKIPSNRQVHHTCENTLCVNPDHLSSVTPAGHRQAHAKKLDWDKVRMIRESSLSSRKLAAMLGVSHRMVLDVRNGKNWREAA